MKFTRNSSLILLAGLLAIGATWSYRQYVLARRRPAVPIAARTSPTDTAVLQAQQDTLRAQAARLQARLALHPDDLAIRHALLLTYQQSGQTGQAMAQLEAIALLQPGNPNVTLALANGRLALKQWGQAELAYRAMTRKWPKMAPAWQGLAAAQYHQGHFQEAALAAQRAEALEPANPSSRYLLASSLVEYAMQYPQPQLHTAALEWARREFEHLTQVWPKTGDIYLRLGRICIATRDFAAGSKYLEKAAILLPNRADVTLFLAKSYASARNTRAARRLLEQGVANHADSADLCDALGQLIQSSGELTADERARALYQKAVQLAPRNARFQERLGTAFLRANRLTEARQAFEDAARLNPNRAFPFQQLAAVYARLKDPQHAAAAKQSEILNFNAQQLSHLEALVNTHPDSVALHGTLADRYRFLGDSGAARNEYLALLRLVPQDQHARQSLAALNKLQTSALTAMTAPTP